MTSPASTLSKKLTDSDDNISLSSHGKVKTSRNPFSRMKKKLEKFKPSTIGVNVPTAHKPYDDLSMSAHAAVSLDKDSSGSAASSPFPSPLLSRKEVSAPSTIRQLPHQLSIQSTASSAAAISSSIPSSPDAVSPAAVEEAEVVAVITEEDKGDCLVRSDSATTDADLPKSVDVEEETISIVDTLPTSTMTTQKAIANTAAVLAIGEDEQVEVAESLTYKLELYIVAGTGLIARDKNGFSDPYVKVKQKRKMLYKTSIVPKSLNPRWDEHVFLRIPKSQMCHPIYVRMYDYDKFSGDDFMGQAVLHIDQLERDKMVELDLKLAPKSDEDDDLPDQLGFVSIKYKLSTESATLIQTSDPSKSSGDACDGKLKLLSSANKNNHSTKAITDSNLSNLKSSTATSASGLRSILNRVRREDNSGQVMSDWDYTVCVALVAGRNLLPMDDNGFSDPFVKFKLQGQKYRSKTKSKTLNPDWMEVFTLHLYENRSWILDILVFDSDIAGRTDFMGRTCLDLKSLKVDKTHDLTLPLEDEAGTLRLQVTVTGAVSTNDNEVSQTQRDEIAASYGLLNSFSDIRNVGWLQVKLIRARDLMSMDLGGKSDPFCRIQLVNTTLLSQTAYSTLNPEWNRVFTLPVHDIHSILEIIVFDEDKDMKKEFIGKVGIPLIKIEPGVQKWFGLKNSKLMGPSKGAILLEMDICYNQIKAAIATLNPREEKIIKEEPKLKIATLKRNVNRVRAMTSGLSDGIKVWTSIIAWERPVRTVTAFVAFMLAVWNFELYMLPLGLVILFLWNYAVVQIRGGPPDPPAVAKMAVEKPKKVFEVIHVIQFGPAVIFSGACMSFTQAIMLSARILIRHTTMPSQRPFTYLVDAPQFMCASIIANSAMWVTVHHVAVWVTVHHFADPEGHEDDFDDVDDEKETKTSLITKLDSVLSTVCMVQEIIGVVASHLESVKNSVNWSVPWLSTLALVILSVITVVLYYIPLRYLIMLWGLNKFTKKLRSPNYIPNTELLDYLSRVPSDVELVMYSQITPNLDFFDEADSSRRHSNDRHKARRRHVNHSQS